MRKRNVAYIVDKLFWVTIAVLPIAILLLSWFRLGTTEITLASVLADFGVSSNNVIYTTLDGLLGGSGAIFEMFTSSGILLYFTYFVGIELLHLLVDFLLFLPRWAQKLIHKGDE